MPSSGWTLLSRELEGHYPPGMYVACWNGSGQVDVTRWDVTRVTRRTPGRLEFEVNPGHGGIQIDVSSSDARNPVRDFRVWMPGFENAASAFHPTFVGRLKPARILRFMDWQRTNDSPLVKWDDRPKPGDARYSTVKGVPLEVIVDLANESKTDPWLCVPHRADDGYVREFARLVKARLAADRTVYVEYSNEVWNWQFGQTQWAREQGVARRLGDPEQARFYAERSMEVFRIWEEEIPRHRLVRVLSSQFVNPWMTEQILGWKDAYRRADAVAVAPYGGYEHGDPKRAAATRTKSVDALLDELAKEVDGPNRELVSRQAAVAKKFGVRLLAYEGGQHLAGFGGAENDPVLAKLFAQANRHPRMADLYRSHLDNWFSEGGGPYVLLAYVGRPTKWGSWGLLEYQDQLAADAPKYRAFSEYRKR